MDIKGITEEYVFGIIKKRDPDAHKGSFGTLTALCGSKFFPGAAALSVSAALRCGAGIVRLASTERVCASVSAKISECIFLPLPESALGGVSADGEAELLSAVGRSSACLCGCGMINCEDTRLLVQSLIENAKCPLVIDADGLNVLCGRADIFKKAAHIPVITPHLREFSRLSGADIKAVQPDPAEAALLFSQKHRCVTVLKGSVTYIASPDGRVYRYSRKNPGLSKGGSGDLLAGMISSLVSQGTDGFDAAVCGVYLHGEAAAACASRLSETAMLPSDILFDLCGIFKSRGL